MRAVIEASERAIGGEMSSGRRGRAPCQRETGSATHSVTRLLFGRERVQLSGVSAEQLLRSELAEKNNRYAVIPWLARVRSSKLESTQSTRVNSSQLDSTRLESTRVDS